jgi:hypothetical protein
VTPAATPGAGVRFDWDPPLPEFHFELNRFAELISDFSPLFETFSVVFQNWMREAFATEGESTGPVWAPLKPAYEAWKAKHYPGGSIGVRTRAFLESMTGGEGYEEVIGPTEASFGQSEAATHTDDGSYGAFFNYGWHHRVDAGWAPPRPVLRFTPGQGRQFSSLAAMWVRQSAHHAGLLGTLSSVATAPLSDLSYSEPLPAD